MANRKHMITLTLIITSLGVLHTSQANPTQQAAAAIAERLKPVGQVQIQGESAQGSTQQASTETSKQALSGEQIYERNCITCHDSGVANAPKLSDKDAWEKRKETKGGVDGLIKSAINGVNFMPPKGTCIECSDAEIEAAVKFMLEQ